MRRALLVSLLRGCKGLVLQMVQHQVNKYPHFSTLAETNTTLGKVYIILQSRRHYPILKPLIANINTRIAPRSPSNFFLNTNPPNSDSPNYKTQPTNIALTRRFLHTAHKTTHHRPNHTRRKARTISSTSASRSRRFNASTRSFVGRRTSSEN